MREFFSAFGSEVYRPLVTLILPGAVGVFPWFVALMDKSDLVRSFVAGRPPEATLAFLLATLFFGHVFEDVGSRLESHVFDRLLDRRTKGLHTENWCRYLRIAYRVEPIGHRYLRTLVLRMKFELDSVPALLSVALGSWFTNVKVVSPLVLTVVAAVLAVGLFLEAHRSHHALSKVRAMLLEGIIEAPSGNSGAS